MRTLSLKTHWQLLVAILAIALLPELLQAGSLGWETMAQDASDSFQGLAHGAIPILGGATLIASSMHFGGLATNMAAVGAATYGASHGSELQAWIGSGAGGGLITDIVPLLIV